MIDLIEERVISLIASRASIDATRISRAAKLRDLGIPACLAIEITFAIEDAFDINVPLGACDLVTGTVGEMITALHAAFPMPVPAHRLAARLDHRQLFQPARAPQCALAQDTQYGGSMPRVRSAYTPDTSPRATTGWPSRGFPPLINSGAIPMDDSIEERVIAIIANSTRLEASTITPAATLKSLGVDSLDAIEVIFDIEESFGITLPDRAPDFEADTVAGLIEAVAAALPDVGVMP